MSEQSSSGGAQLTHPEDLVKWGRWKVVPLRDGTIKEVRTSLGKLPGDFWPAWRAVDPTDKRGLSPKKVKKGDWKLNQWRDSEIQKAAELPAAEQLKNFKKSWGTDSKFDCPMPEGTALIDFQRAGVEFLVENKRCFQGDQVGLGKTVQTISVTNYCADVSNVLCIVPAPLKANWRREWEKFSCRPLNIIEVSGRKGEIPAPDPDRLNVYIINYQICHHRQEFLHDTPWDMLVMDESGKFLGNPKSKTCEAVTPIRAERIYALSATPFSVKFKQLWPTLHMLRPDLFYSWNVFAARYCGGWENNNDLSENGKHLGCLLRGNGVLIRRHKRQVLKEFPEINYKVTTLPPSKELTVAADLHAGTLTIDDASLADLAARMEASQEAGDVEAVRQIANDLEIAENAYQSQEAFMKMRKDHGVAKVRVVAEYVRIWLANNPDEKLIILGHHIDVLRGGLSLELEEFGVCLLDGSTKSDEDPVSEFQGNPEKRIFIGSKSAYEGITLTAANYLMWVEVALAPADIAQGNGRHHRIGQERDCVVEYLLIEESFEVGLFKSKQTQIKYHSDLLDQKEMDEEGFSELKVEKTRDEKEGETITTAEMIILKANMKKLRDLSRTTGQDGVGVRSIDISIVNYLAKTETWDNTMKGRAAKLSRTYHKQLK